MWQIFQLFCISIFLSQSEYLLGAPLAAVIASSLYVFAELLKRCQAAWGLWVNSPFQLQPWIRDWTDIWTWPLQDINITGI